MTTFADPLLRAERCFAEREAVIDGDVRLLFGDLVDRCRRLVAVLQAAIQPGDRVAVLGDNSHRVLELNLATPAAGRLIVPLNTRHAPAELAYALKDSGARLLLTDRPRESLGELVRLVDRVIEFGSEYEDWIAAAPRADLGGHAREDDVSGLFYTGGTTGAAKGVMLTHRNRLADALHLQTCVRLGGDDRWLVLGPMYHASGSFQALLCVWLGVPQLLLPGFDAPAVLDVVAEQGATIAFGVPTMLSALAEEQAERPREVRGLRLLGYGAAPAGTTLLRRFHALFPGTELVSMYGATELAPMGTSLEHVERMLDTERARSAGRPVVGTDLRILDDGGDELAPHRVGEVVVRGPNVMRGYWRKPEETAAVLRNGWYHTGDLGYLDEGGCLFLVDRVKDLIVSGGENVYSSEVEETLSRHPSVLECAVFAVPDERWGEAVRAAVVLRGGAAATEAELRDHCRSSLAGYKVPKRIALHVDPLPRTGAGKILKRELRAPFWQGRDRGIHG